VDWIGLAQDSNRWRALVNSVLNLRVPWNAGKLSSGLTSRGLSSSAQFHRVSEFWNRTKSCYWQVTVLPVKSLKKLMKRLQCRVCYTSGQYSHILWQ
jgi:hypothetical protein